MKDIDLLCQNAVEVIDKEDFFLRLEASAKNKTPLRVKAGFDPSAPDIHLGHTVLLRRLRQFQDLGHKVILIIGDATAQIGDPTGQSKTRPILTREQIETNSKTYTLQAFKILDDDHKKIEVVHNSQWLDTPEMLKTFLSIAGRVTIDQLLVRDDFDKRRKAHRPIALLEMLYPIMQGYDSVAVKADVELGGTDQLFNLLMGREIQSLYKMKPQIVMTLPLLVGLDGAQKMSKSYGNYIGVTDSPKDMFGKVMSIPDSLMETYYNLLTNIKPRVASMEEEIHPKEAKMKLAKMIVSSYYGEKAAADEAEQFERIFSKKEAPENPEELAVPEKEIWIAELLKRAGAAASTGEAKRLIEQGAVSIDGQKISDFNLKWSVKKGALLKAGKKKFVKIV